MLTNIPSTGFLRLPQVLAIIPISKSVWWEGCKTGRFQTRKTRPAHYRLESRRHHRPGAASRQFRRERGGCMSSTRLEKQVEEQETKLKEKKAQISREKRKERGGQLVALGIMVEVAFKRLPPAQKAMLRSWAEPLDARNKQRVLAAFERLGLEERALESAPQAEQPQSLNEVRAHLPVSSGN